MHSPDRPKPAPVIADSQQARRTVWLTGGSGFIGRHLGAQLALRSDLRVVAPSRAQLNLTDQAAVDSFLATVRPDVVIHLAAVTAGSGAMRQAPARYFAENLDSATPLLRAVEQGRVPRVLVAGSAGAYPRLGALGEAPRGLTPADVWRGPPAAAGYGLARRAISQLLLDAAATAGGEAAVLVMPTVYGPGDGGDGPVNTATLRALPAFVARMLTAIAAGEDAVTHFGSGFEMRDFLHVFDAVAAFEAALDGDISGQRLHITAGEAVEMQAVAAAVAAATGFVGAHRWAGRAPGQTASDDQVWLAAAGLAALGVTPRLSLADGLPGVVADLRARLLG